MGFEQIVSLGHNCPVAASMEKYGFRSFSGPFDWLGSKFVSNYEDSEIRGGVMGALATEFGNFLDYEKLIVHPDDSKIFSNYEQGFTFFHDVHQDFKSEYPNIKAKYDRRIKRFLKAIKQPTLFIRMVMNFDEMKYILANRKEVTALVKNFNHENVIIYIAATAVDLSPLQEVGEICFSLKADRNLGPRSKMRVHGFFDGCYELLDFLRECINANTLRQNLYQRHLKLKKQVLQEMHMARLDIKNLEFGNVLRFIECSPGVKVDAPEWFKDQSGQGYVLTSASNSFHVKLATMGRGGIEIILRGVDKRNLDGVMLPYWIDYKSVRVNGQEMLAEPCPAWHNAPNRLRMTAYSGMTINIEVSWSMHHYTEDDMYKLVLEKDIEEQVMTYWP